MSVSDFVAYGSSPDLSPDEVYTIEFLIETVRNTFDRDWWREWEARWEARRAVDYVPSFDREHLRPAGEALWARSRSFLILVGQGAGARPIRDIRALAFFPETAHLILSGHGVTDLEPLRGLTALETLDLSCSTARDLSPLSGCVRLTEIVLPEGPFPDLSPLAGCLRLEAVSCLARVEDLSLLETLPRLSVLYLSAENLPAFRRLTRLPRVTRLAFFRHPHAGVDSYQGFPELPELRSLKGPRVESLEGIQRFPNLRNLKCAPGTYDSLTPLHALPHLTHLTIRESGLRSLETASGLSALRRLELRTDRSDFDLEPLKALPCLHEVIILAANGEPAPHPGLEALRAELSSWDTEFLAAEAHHTPSPRIEVEVVDRKAEDCWTPGAGTGLAEVGDNEGMLESEKIWLEERLERAVASLPGNLTETLTIGGGLGQSRTMPAEADTAEPLERLPILVPVLQRELCRCVNDWNIHLLAKFDVDNWFALWIHPDKVVVCAEHAERARGLLSGPPVFQSR